jgi:hypothetical protein
VEADSSAALELVTKTAEAFERDRADRRKMLTVLSVVFSAIVTLATLVNALWTSYRAEQRERDRDARELQQAVERAAVERARSTQQGHP